MTVDVAVVGGGLAGLATATQLALHGRQVVCLEPRPWPRSAVGESLEFSAPSLLSNVGIDVTSSDQPYLFPKTSVQILSPDEEFTVWPPAWFAQPPIWCSRITFHTDRTALDQQLRDRAIDAGVEILPERITKVDHEHMRISSLTTDQENRVIASWYVDATGHMSRVFGRALRLDRELLGRPRAAYWARFGEPPDGHATKLFFPEPTAHDLTWIWEIPLNNEEVSIGVVMSAARLNVLRAGGTRPSELFERLLDTIPRLRDIVRRHSQVELHATSYIPYRHRQSAGPNWLLVGDASGMVDPLTSNGVTSALRHAEQAARTISNAPDHDLSPRQTWMYRNTAPATVATLNRAIESFLYEPEVRRHLGLRWAVSFYAATGVITNSLYAKIRPTTTVRSGACAIMLAASRSWTRISRSALPHLPQLTRTGLESRPPAADDVTAAPTNTPDSTRLDLSEHKGSASTSRGETYGVRT